MAILYRVLTDRCLDDPGTLKRWQEGKYTSTHGIVPGDWTVIWETKHHSTNPKDYCTTVDGCEYTPDALEAFLGFAPSHKKGDIWPQEERNLTGEYVGVSAFDSAKAALNYGEGGRGKSYLVFEGEKLFPLAPEANEGAYVVRFVKEIAPPMRRDTFLE